MDIIMCISRIYPDWAGAVHGNSYDGIMPGESETRMPTLSELEAVWPAVQSELSMMPIRAERDRLLDETDTKYCNAEKWSAMTAETKTLWATYKQALRDLPTTVDPDNPVWPTKPT